MTLPQAIRSAFARWLMFSGRAGGTEYWWFVLFGTIVFGLASLLDHALFERDALFWAISLVFLMPYLAVAVRRLHDTNRSGWWLLLIFVPLVGNIVLLIWFCTPSSSGPNRFGPMPGAILDGVVAAR
ncbi:MAG TPA: DUF805 domain-containing protein [Candidatus Baltobacteraceae bacterium]|jgi:uncharacterized membrane protein YhaH (DUF805 family)